VVFNITVICWSPVGNVQEPFVNGISAMGVNLASTAVGLTITTVGLAKSQILGDHYTLKWYHVGK